MFREAIRLVRQDRRLQWIIGTGFMIQLIVSITAIGFSNFDQHFSIIEFSQYQLGNENGAHYAFELRNQIRPTLQVYMFSGFYELCTTLGITDPYTQLLILRLITGILLFIAFNLVSLHYFRNDKRNIFYWVLLILNFSWLFPYTRTLFNSEMFSGLCFFTALAWYDAKKENAKPLALFFLGFLFCLSFYFRFQMGLAILGFGIWLLFFEKKYRHLPLLLMGFLVAFAINVFLDRNFYGNWVLTPYRYFYDNIIIDKASEFGTSSVLKYLGTLIAVISAPPFSIILFVFMLIGLFRNFKNPVFLSVLFFIFGHSLIGHKEERFLYPIFSALPLMAGWSMPYLLKFYNDSMKWIRITIKSLLIATIVVNLILLLLFTVVPYSQTVHFGNKLRKQFKNSGTRIYCLYRTPFETVSGVPMVFYQKEIRGFELKKVFSPDSLFQLTIPGGFIATTYNEVKPQMHTLDSLGFKPVRYSSSFLWKLNRFLHGLGRPTVNDSWVLYQKF